MKKTLLLVFTLLAGGFFFITNDDRPVNAQKTETGNSPERNSPSDIELAQYLKQITDRSNDNLTETAFGDGFRVDLTDRFQNVMLARLEPEGDLTSACVASLSEANSFFGRDLETGKIVEQTRYPKEALAEVAARHGMSVEEYLYYKKLADLSDQRELTPQSATITIVNNDSAGEGFNDPAAAPNPGEGGNNAVTVGGARLAVFNQAAAIWGSILDSNVATQVNAQFNSQFCDASSAVLGSAGTTGAYRDFPGAPAAGTWYHYALANKILRVDADAVSAEINATFNSNVNGAAGCLGGARFYYGFDNATPAGTVNLLVVVLHELGHGLGFSSLANSSTGTLLLGYPDAYIRNIYDKTTGLNWASMNDAQRQASAVNTHNVLWDGESVKTASGYLSAGRETSTGRVQLYTPNPVQSGSSVSHWDTDATTNLLMEPSINIGLPLDLDLTKQQMRDIGWYRDTDPTDTVKDSISGVAPSGGTVYTETNQTIFWTNVGGFNKNVTIELSTDGGSTYPTTIASNIANTGSYNWTVPSMTTSTARIRVREHNFADLRSASSSNFSISAPPTAARIFVSGRVADYAGRAIAGAVVTLTGVNGNTRNARTGVFGHFRFDDLEAGQTYIATAASGRYRFAAQVLEARENVTGLNFIPDAPAPRR